MMEVNKIKEARLAAGLSQKQLADLLEVSVRVVQSWDQGVRQPPRYAEKLILEKLESLKISDVKEG